MNIQRVILAFYTRYSNEYLTRYSNVLTRYSDDYSTRISRSLQS